MYWRELYNFIFPKDDKEIGFFKRYCEKYRSKDETQQKKLERELISYTYELLEELKMIQELKNI